MSLRTTNELAVSLSELGNALRVLKTYIDNQDAEIEIKLENHINDLISESDLNNLLSEVFGR